MQEEKKKNCVKLYFTLNEKSFIRLLFPFLFLCVWNAFQLTDIMNTIYLTDVVSRESIHLILKVNSTI